MYIFWIGSQGEKCGSKIAELDFPYYILPFAFHIEKMERSVGSLMILQEGLKSVFLKSIDEISKLSIFKYVKKQILTVTAVMQA